MGTPDFARSILERLVADGHEVCGVFTQPDKPRNRNKVTPSPVKEYALTQNIPVFQPTAMRDGTALADLKALAPDLAGVAAYGRILPEEMLAVPPLGCINAHASILPKYRGAAPINWAILNGEKETGVTVMHMAKECDTGDMILVKTQDIHLIAEMARKGTLTNIDLQIQDICNRPLPDLPLDATASNFGKADGNASPEDIASGIIHMVLQSIGQAAILSALNSPIRNFVLIGNLTQLPQFKEIFPKLEEMYGVRFLIPKYSEYRTAIGAALTYMDGAPIHPIK